MRNALAFVLSVHDDSRYADRYTVYFVPDPRDYTGSSDCVIPYLACNDTPTHPACGFSQFGEVDCTQRQTDHRIAWESLPENVRKHVVARWTD